MTTEFPDLNLANLEAEFAERAESAEIADRQRQIDADEMRRWAEYREDARRSPNTVVTKSAPARAAAAPSSGLTRAWEDHIAREIKRAEQRTIKIVMEVVGEAMGKLRDDLRAEFKTELEREVLKLRAEFLQNQLAEERGTRRLKAVPDKSTLIA